MAVTDRRQSWLGRPTFNSVPPMGRWPTWLLGPMVLITWTDAAPADFIGLGSFGGPSLAWAVSADGTTVVGSGGGSGDAFSWTRSTGLVNLGPLPQRPQDGTTAFGVSGEGSVIVGRNGADSGAIRWTQATGWQLIPGSLYEAMGVSANGSVVVGRTYNYEAYRWTQGGGAVLLGGPYSEAFAASANGSVIVGFGTTTQGQMEAFRWTQATGMTFLGGFRTEARGVSADGSVIVGYDDNFQVFRWTQATGLVDLGIYGQAFGVSGDGSVVVGDVRTNLGTQAFIWDSSHGMRLLSDVLTQQGDDLTGWRLDVATGISADGRTIVGYGEGPTGQPEAWVATLATPAPEPPALYLFGLGIVAVLGYGWRTVDEKTRPN